jgi:hypothetical protein
MFSSQNSQVSQDANYIEDVFSTWLYTGNGSTQTITNGIDLAGKGGLVWLKQRSGSATSHTLMDTARGTSVFLSTNNTNANTAYSVLSSFNTNGFTIGQGAVNNASGQTYASWTFRKQPKFFDVVTYTGDGAFSQQINHNLGSTPGFILIKRTNTTGDWAVAARISDGAYAELKLNTTEANLGNFSPSATSTSVVVGENWATTSPINASGSSYVMYLFAHNAGGFGLTGTDNVISCGSFTTDGSGNATVNLGYEPQLVLRKQADGSDWWNLSDSMRGMSHTTTASLYPNTNGAEYAGPTLHVPTATGFNVTAITPNATYIYIAIRRGPMKVPTTGASVFTPVRYTTSPEGFITGFPVDFGIAGNAAGTDKWYWQSRLQGAVLLNSASTAAEVGSGSAKFDMMNGYGTGFSTAYYSNAFRRAPGFMDVCCYTGTGSVTTVAHNLTVAPELLIVKRRDSANYAPVWNKSIGDDYILKLFDTQANSDDPKDGPTDAQFNQTAPTASVFTLGTSSSTNGSGGTYVAWMWATCAGVSKVGSYTGTGTTQQINCGFTAGARFVLIKRTDSTGDWYVWDSARGIVSGNDPYLLLNSTAAEVTSTDYVDTYSAGFEISSTAPAAINASGGTFIFLAIA